MLLAALISGEAQAQLDIPLPPARSGVEQSDPGQIQRRIEQELERPPPTKAPDIPLPSVAPPAIPEDEAPATFVLTAVVIDGATVFEPADFGPLYEEYLATEIALTEIDEILKRMTRLYQDEGFILSRAVAPPQDLAGGLLQVRVIEGFVDSVIFDGGDPDRWGLEGYAERITSDRPLNLSRLERMILLMNDLSGLSVAPSLRPIDEDSGSYELILALDEDILDGVLYSDNRGTPAVGRLQGALSAGANSTLGLGERMQLVFFTVPNEPEELIFFELQYQQPLGSNGTAVALSGTGSRSEPGGEFRLLDTKSHSRTFALRGRHPLIRSRELNLWFTGSFDYRNFRERRLATTFQDDRLRVIRGRADLSLADSLDGANFLRAEISQGLDILGASNPGSLKRSRIDGETEFTKVSGQIVRQQALGEHVNLQLSGAGQYAFDALLSSEEFALGGTQYGRAYDFSEVTGEDGLVGSVELALTPPIDVDWLPDLQFYGFYDIGAVWNDVPGGGSTRDSLSSAGGGLRLILFDSIQAGIEVGKPLTRRVSTRDSKGPRVFFFVSASF